jgi:pimeloyl-ACP methyl ester carboxylesterase
MTGTHRSLTATAAQFVTILSLLWGQRLCAQADTSPHSERQVKINDVTLHYLDWGGQGEPLVLLTGYGASAHIFDALATRFNDTFRVIALTRRGRQPSQAPSSGYELSTLVADIKGLLDSLKVQRVHLVAHSFGGAEATQFAIVFPDRVASVVYLDAALDAAAGETVMKESPMPNPQPAPGTPYAQVLQWWTTYTPDFTKVRHPALALYAIQNNPPLPPTANDDLRRRASEYWQTKMLPMVRTTIEKFKREAPSGRVVVLEGASHYLFRDREADVVREMKTFYASLPR